MAAMTRPSLFVLAMLALAACGGAHYQTISIVNRTPRVIQELYVYPSGSANHGASRGTLAPEGKTAVKVPQGNVEILALSAKVKIDEHTRDQPSATQQIELKAPTEVVFYDAGQKPPGVDQPGVIGVVFTVLASKAPPPTPAPAPAE
jgi:hypothetical protein